MTATVTGPPPPPPPPPRGPPPPPARAARLFRRCKARNGASSGHPGLPHRRDEVACAAAPAFPSASRGRLIRQLCVEAVT
jgi:hypothetical protein